MKDLKLRDGDIVFDTSGKLVLITGQERLDQDIEKIIATRRDRLDTKRADEDYGSDLFGIIENPPFSVSQRSNLAAGEIRRSMEKLIEIHKRIYRDLADKALFPANERLSAVKGIQVWVPDSEPRELDFRFTVSSGDTEQRIEGRTQFGSVLEET